MNIGVDWLAGWLVGRDLSLCQPHCGLLTTALAKARRVSNCNVQCCATIHNSGYTDYTHYYTHYTVAGASVALSVRVGGQRVFAGLQAV